MTGPTLAEVEAATERVEPATASEVREALGAPWEQRQVIRNRLDKLVATGRLITDWERPRRYALNHLGCER